MKKLKEMSEVEQAIYAREIVNYQGKDRIVKSTELWEKLQSLPPNEIAYPLGYQKLDRILNNVEGGELVLVTGLTSDGKTTFLQSVTANMSTGGINSLWFSFEVTPQNLLKKMKLNGTLPVFYIPKEHTENSPEWLEERIFEAINKYNVKVVFIDHINHIVNLENFRRGMSTSLEIAEIATKLKNIALKYNLIVFLIAHCKDLPSGKSEVTASDVRDSGMIIRLADTVLTVQRVPNYYKITDKKIGIIGEDDTWVKIKVEKNRREGKRGYMLATYENGLIRELTQEEIISAEELEAFDSKKTWNKK